MTGVQTCALPISLLAAAPVSAAERGYTISDFDRIDVSGPFVVQVETGKGPSARATGESAALDRLSVELRGRTLRIGAGVNGLHFRGRHYRQPATHKYRHSPGSDFLQDNTCQTPRSRPGGRGHFHHSYKASQVEH